MKQKLLAALEQRYGGALGLKNEIYEKVVSAYGNLITSEEQIPDIVTGVEPLLKQYQSVNDKLRTLENSQTPNTGNNTPPEPSAPAEQPDFKKLFAEAVADVINPLREELTTLKAETAAKSAFITAETAFKNNDYVKRYADEAADAWERATELYEAGGRKWSADELQDKAMGYFANYVKRKGGDITKPFESEGGGGGEMNFDSFDRAIKELGWDKSAES